MAARPTWSGQLRLSLVSFPVRLYPASNPGRAIQFHQIYKPTGQRVRYQTIVPDIGPVSKDDIVKGYEYRRGKYVTFEPEELEEVRLSARHTIDLVQFVDVDDIDPIYYDRPYFLVPEDEAANEAFAVVREALKAERKAGLGEVVFSGKEHLVAIRASGKGMLLETLHYQEEVRKSEEYFEDIDRIKLQKDQLDLAKELIARKTAEFNPGKFHDHYEDAVRKLIKAKVSGEALEPEEEQRPTNVINLMDALKRSVSQSQSAKIAPRSKGKAKPEPKKTAKKTPPKKSPSRRKAG